MKVEHLTTNNINWRVIPGLTSHTSQIPRKYTIEQVAELVSKVTGISLKAMKMETRKREIVEARAIVYYITTKILVPNYTTVVAGMFFFQDHATVVYARRELINHMKTDGIFHYKIMSIIEDIGL